MSSHPIYADVSSGDEGQGSTLNPMNTQPQLRTSVVDRLLHIREEARRRNSAVVTTPLTNDARSHPLLDPQTRALLGNSNKHAYSTLYYCGPNDPYVHGEDKPLSLMSVDDRTSLCQSSKFRPAGTTGNHYYPIGGPMN